MAVRQLNRITDEMYLPRREIDPQRRRVPIWEALESWACRRRCYRKPIVTVTPITCMERQLPSGDEVTELKLSVPEAGKRLLPLPVAAWHKTVGKRAVKDIAKGDDVLVHGQLARRYIHFCAYSQDHRQFLHCRKHLRRAGFPDLLSLRLHRANHVQLPA